MNNRWSIFIDIEGFSSLHEKSELEAHRRLNNLIEDIYKIGTVIYPEEPDRLFVHQLGDGFVIVSSFPENDLYRPLSIALALMQSALLKGGVCKTAISNGSFADVQGMRSEIIRNNTNECGTIELGYGIMRLFPVMGGALINSFKAQCKTGSGPLFVVDKRLEQLIPNEIKINNTTDKLLYFNWLHIQTELSQNILTKLGHGYTRIDELSNLLNKYLLENKSLPQDWIENAKKLL